MTQAHSLKCPSCGASVAYDGITRGSLICILCRAEIPVPKAVYNDDDLPDPPTPANMPGDAENGVTPAVTNSASGGQPKGGQWQSLNENAQEILKLLNSGQKFNAVQRYRAISGVGLKQATDMLETIEVWQKIRRSKKNTFIGCLILALAVGCISLFLATMFIRVPFRLSGSYSQALQAAQSNPAVMEALGTPIQSSWWPIMGKANCFGNACYTKYSVAIFGSRKSGYLNVNSKSTGASLFNEGTWILNATVFVDGGPTIQLNSWFWNEFEADLMAVPPILTG